MQAGTLQDVWFWLLPLCAAGYLMGSISSAILVCRLFGYPDPRTQGSNNPGATNVLRTGRKDLALATLILDAGKGGIAVLIARHFLGELPAIVAGVSAFAGHCWPIWLKFKGGKGFATYLGTLLALNWIVGLLVCLTWLIIAFARRYSSLAALTSSAAAPVFAWIWSGVPLSAACALLTVFIYLRHKENILRLMDGTETKIGGEKSQTEG